jgi:hypothetical protein
MRHFRPAGNNRLEAPTSGLLIPRVFGPGQVVQYCMVLQIEHGISMLPLIGQNMGQVA